MNSKILITGCSGFIGSHIVEHFLDMEYDIVCLVRNSSKLEWIDKSRVELIYGDFSNLNNLYKSLKDISIVIHNAGITLSNNVDDYYKINSEGTKNLLHQIVKSDANIQRFVYISSQTVGGPANSYDYPVTEQDTPNPISHYAKSKLKAEKHIISFSDKIPFTILRPSAVFGNRDTASLDLFKVAKLGISPVVGLTDKYLNIINVKDITKAIEQVLINPKTIGETYYIADNKKLSWIDLNKLIVTAINKDKSFNIRIPEQIVKIIGKSLEYIDNIHPTGIKFNYEKSMDFVQDFWLCSTEKAKNHFDFKTNDNLQELFNLTADWYKKEGWL